MLAWGNLEAFAEVVRAHADVQLVLDHLGIMQPFEPPAPADAFAALPDVLALAALPNLAIKISGACTLAHEPYPFPDIWPPLLEIAEAFGIDRCLWGTDWTRAVEVVSPEDSVNAFRKTNAFSESDRAALMGGSLSAIYDWRPG